MMKEGRTGQSVCDEEGNDRTICDEGGKDRPICLCRRNDRNNLSVIKEGRT